jgi:hypothetical protein
MATGEGRHDPTRSRLHRVAAHILARRRYAACGRFGLRASPGGFATPAFGDGPETLRVSGTTIVREVGGLCSSAPIVGSTLRDLAVFAQVDLDAPFDCGADTPPVGDVEEVIELDNDALSVLAGWYGLGWRALDSVVAGLAGDAAPATVQLWPEHFDAGTDVGVAAGERVNLGFSPGDSFEPEPYAYVGPWEMSRLPAAAFWNAPFGAVLRRSDVSASVDPVGECTAFLRAGLRLASGVDADITAETAP